MADAGRARRRGARRIAADVADKRITAELWESRLKGNAEEQASVAVQFLRAMQISLVNAMEEMGVRR